MRESIDDDASAVGGGRVERAVARRAKVCGSVDVISHCGDRDDADDDQLSTAYSGMISTVTLVPRSARKSRAAASVVSFLCTHFEAPAVAA